LYPQLDVELAVVHHRVNCPMGLLDDTSEVHGGAVDLNPGVVVRAECEQVLDQVSEPFGVPVRDTDPPDHLVVHRPELAVRDHLEIAGDAGQGRAQLVRDVRHEGVLGAVELSQAGQGLPLLLERLDLEQASAEVVRDVRTDGQLTLLPVTRRDALEH
jgi:hypothetical protein